MEKTPLNVDGKKEEYNDIIKNTVDKISQETDSEKIDIALKEARDKLVKLGLTDHGVNLGMYEIEQNAGKKE